MDTSRFRVLAGVGLLATLTAACSWEPLDEPAAAPPAPVPATGQPQRTAASPSPYQSAPHPADGTRRAHAALMAERMIGTPYRYEGADLAGFDCSGLVQLAYGQAGIEMPRTAAHQRRMVQRIGRTDLAPGDLVFFDISKKTDHVGVYVGQGRFVHAPSSGKRVQFGRLDTGFFARHFAEAGRVPGSGAPLAPR